MRKASLMSNAFITIQEDSVSFDQIRGTEMMAYFDTTTVLQRFDALGGASAVFYLEENDALATVNKVESKMLSAYFDKGDLQRIYYFDNPHNDAYPTVQLPKDDRQMKGFRWDPERRPTGMIDITPYVPRASERLAYEARPQAKFPQTEIYFPGYMKEVYAGLAARDSAQRASRRMRDSLELDKPRIVPPPDSVSAVAPPDETAPDTEEQENEEPAPEETPEEEIQPGQPETEGTGESAPKQENAPENPEEKELTEEPAEPEAPVMDPHTADSLARVKAVRDSIRAEKAALKAARDSIKAIQDSIQAVKDAALALKKAERDSIRQVKLAKKEARWAQLDERDAVRDSIKALKKQIKYRETVAKKLEIRDKEAEREQQRLEKYIRRYEKIKARRDARIAKRPKKIKPAKAKLKRTKKSGSE